MTADWWTGCVIINRYSVKFWFYVLTAILLVRKMHLDNWLFLQVCCTSLSIFSPSGNMVMLLSFLSELNTFYKSFDLFHFFSKFNIIRTFFRNIIQDHNFSLYFLRFFCNLSFQSGFLCLVLLNRIFYVCFQHSFFAQLV